MHEHKHNKRSAGLPGARVGQRGARVEQQASNGASKPRIRDVPDPKLSRSMEYGIAILESFSPERLSLGVAQLAEIVGISRSTAHRYAMTLVMLGYLEQDPRRKYRLSRRAGGPGSSVIGALRREIPARAVLEELREQTGHTVSMGVLDRDRVVYIHRLFGHRCGQHLVDRDIGVGAHVPVHCTAIGKALLASLAARELEELLEGLKLTSQGPNTIVDHSELLEQINQVRLQEVALSDEELLDGERSIALAVMHPRDDRRLAIEVSAPATAYTLEKLQARLEPHLRRAARLISSHSQ